MRFIYGSAICVSLLALGQTARAGYLPAPRLGENSAYKVVEISEEEYQNNLSGNVYKSYAPQADGSLLPQYFQYEINTEKQYAEIVTKSDKGSGAGEETYVPGGAGLNNTGKQGNITNVLYKDNQYQFDYIGDEADVYVQGGALFNSGVIGDKNDNGEFSGVALEADFIGNSLSAQVETQGGLRTQGGALANKGEMGLIRGDFIKNSSTGRYAWGGALYNDKAGSIAGIEGDFVGNAVVGESSGGGAVINEGQMGLLDSDFVANSVQTSSYAAGGAIHNNDQGVIAGINGNFVDNNSTGKEQAYGGAIDNLEASIGDIKGDFVNNSAVSEEFGRISGAFGGAMSNQGNVGAIEGNFYGNHATAQVYASGGAVFNSTGHIDGIEGNFTGNSAESQLAGAMGGAIYNEDATIGSVSGVFEDNAAKGQLEAAGGAIYSVSNTDEEGGLRLLNAQFYNNSATAAAGEAKGGAIYSDNITIAAQNGQSVFKGNTANGVNNAVYMENLSSTEKAQLNLEAKEKGEIVFDDAIDGNNYDIAITGDGSGDIVFNSKVDNVSVFSASNGSMFHLGLDGQINTQDYIVDNTAGLPVLTLDLQIDAANNGINNGVVNVSGDVVGTTNVIVNSLNQDLLDNVADASTIFVKAPNDDMGTASAFNVSRVYGSPYMWDSIRNYGGEEDGSFWYLVPSTFDEPEPEPEPEPDPEPEKPFNPVYTPEIPAYIGMQAAAVEQNRGINKSIGDGLRATRDKGCCDRQFKQKHNVWFNVDYNNAEIDAPSEMDADIEGMTAGLDLVSDGYQRVGVFGAYRQGDYDFSGKGKYRAKIGSKIETDSYLGGLYYNYDRRRWNVLATVFGGTQDMNVKTDDRVAFADTNGTQFGASLDIARKFYLPYAWIVEPSLGLYYTALDLDKFTDNLGKTADFDVMHYMEAELGLRFEHLFCANGWTTKVYAKPSVVQTFASGDKVNISGMEEIGTYDSQTLGRMEIGAKFGLSASLSAYVSADYTFGSDYSGYGVDAGLNYAW